MVNGPGRVILAARSVFLRRNSMSRSSTGRVRLIVPTTRGTGVLLPLRATMMRGIVGVDAFERGGEAVGIALAADFAVGDDVDAGALHVADRDDGRVVLRLLQMLLRQPPHLVHARARHRLRQHGAIDQPVRLRIASDHGGRQQMLRQVHDSPCCLVRQVAGCRCARARCLPRQSGRRGCRSARSRPCARCSRIAALKAIAIASTSSTPANTCGLSRMVR